MNICRKIPCALWIVMGMIMALPAQALDLKGLKLEQMFLGNEIPAVHVRFDRQKDNWTYVTGDEVEVVIDWEITVEASYALAPGSEISIYLDGMNVDRPLQSTNNHLNEVHSGRVRLRAAGYHLDEIKSKALEICQTIRGNGGKPNKEHRITRMFRASALAHASTTAPWYTEDSAETSKLMRVDVVCDEDPLWREPIEPASNDLSLDRGKFEVQKVELFLTTFQNQTTSPNAAMRCKKLQVKVRIETNKAGYLQYKLWKQPGDVRERSRYMEMQEDGPFKGRFVLEDTYVETFNQTTYVQYMVEAGGTFGKSTPWKDINIICGGPGAGGLTNSAPGAGPGSELPTFSVTDSSLVLRRLPGNSCPARVRVSSSYRANMRGSFEHYAGCSNGAHEGGMLEADDPVGGKFAVRHDFVVNVTQPGELTCTARPVNFPQKLVVKKLMVNCGAQPPGDRPERAAPERAVPERAAPERAAPERAAPERAAPERAVPERAAPERATPRTH
jgi:hypothetical protein